MKTILAISGLSIIVFLVSCKYSEFDATYAAKQYCNCLQSEREAGKDFFDARTKCDGELMSKNRFFRLDYIGFYHMNYMFLLPDELEDSVAKFHFEFYDYVEKHCCKVGVLGCDKRDSLQVRMKAMKMNPDKE